MNTRTSSPASLLDSARLFKAFADPVRLRLLNLLAEDREVCVCHLHEGRFELPQPTVSRHLAYFRKSGLVAGRKEGLWVHYRLARPSRGCIASSRLPGSCLGERGGLPRRPGTTDRGISCCGGGIRPSFFPELYSL